MLTEPSSSKKIEDLQEEQTTSFVHLKWMSNWSPHCGQLRVFSIEVLYKALII